MDQQFGLKDWLVGFFMILLFSFMINRLFFFSPGAAEVTSSYILYPAIKIQKFFTDPIARYFAKKTDVNTLQEKISNLSIENQDLQATVISLKATINFESATQEIRDYKQKYDFSNQKIVQVLMRSFDDSGHFFWVDAGSNKGVSINMIAIYKNSIIGRVIQVNSLYSKIALITDKRSKIAVSCTQTKSVGIYEGHNNFEPTLEFVPHYKTLEENDLVISTGQGLVYPSGFAVGKIKRFEIQDVAYQAIIEPLINLDHLEFCYLVSL